jgi:hypothetical protein
MKKKILDAKFHSIELPDNHPTFKCDDQNYPWEGDDSGYFLVKIEKGLIKCGFVGSDHKLKLELIGENPFNLMQEIVKRDLTSNKQHLGYIAQEIMIAHRSLQEDTEYIQR